MRSLRKKRAYDVPGGECIDYCIGSGKCLELSKTSGIEEILIYHHGVIGLPLLQNACKLGFGAGLCLP